MAKVLVPVDGSKTSARAVRHVVELARTGAPLEVMGSVATKVLHPRAPVLVK